MVFFLFAEKQRLDEFFDIDDGKKTCNMNLADAKLIMLTCQPKKNKLPPATRNHDRQYPRFKCQWRPLLTEKKTPVPMLNSASLAEFS